jgi:hypothetical protein
MARRPFSRPALPADRTTLTEPAALTELAALARQHVELVLAGALPLEDAAAGATAVRLGGDARADIWMRTWAPGESTGLHDRGGAAAAVAVVSGLLVEYVPTGWSDGWMYLRPIEHGPGSTASFARHHVHDLANPADAPAVTIHVCAPRIRAVRSYEVVHGDLRETASPRELRWAS